MASRTGHDRGVRPAFPPEVAVHIVKLACELPQEHGLPLSHWDAAEIARRLVEECLVPTISSETVRLVLHRHRLRPWRWHHWLSPRAPRDAAFSAQVRTILDLYTRPLAPAERVLCLDEKTSLQPRRRRAPTQPAAPGQPVRLEHEYERAGALHLFAAFDTRSGRVFGSTAPRKRASEFIAFLDHLDDCIGPEVQRIHLILDNVGVHKSRLAGAWLAQHPRFALTFTPVHCSWLNQVEQFFSLIQRKLLRLANYPSCAALADAVATYI
ncbi:MAG TPA: IS630 family transposase, partial [Longimicrobiales bacterium]|nr:IS630 family transposase [Longimicrobiales bacterium]